MEFDTFYITCWEALLKKIDEFDPKVATIQTFCISRINNEAWRAYMKIKSGKAETDVDSDIMKNTLEASDDTIEIEQSLDNFIMYCNTLGIMVNREAFIKEYYSNEKSAPMLAYAWWRVTNKEVRGRDDFQTKRKRQSVCESSTQE